MRLAKYLAAAGVASRRAAEELITARRVTVDGTIVDDPARDVDGARAVAVDGRVVTIERVRVVYAVNKPAGVVSTARDPQKRPTVVSLVRSGRRLYPVGRLDIDTTGLILLTDDGELAHRLTHPRFEVEKTYRAVVSRPPVAAPALQALRAGVELRMAAARPPACICSARTRSSSRSTRDASARSSGCSSRSAIPSGGWSGSDSARSSSAR